jgi:hypothetical protein
MKLGLFLSLMLIARQAPTSFVIDGVVLDSADNRPLAGVQLSLPMRGSPPVLVITDPEGRFGFPQIPSGSYRLSTVKEGYAPAYADGRATPGNPGIPVTVKSGEVVRGLQIHLFKSAIVTGRVFDTAGRPAVRITVSLMRKVFDDTGTPTMSATNSAATDDRGEFRIFGIAAGSYDVVAGTVSMPIILRSGEEARLGDMTVPAIKSVPIRLRIQNQTGETPELMTIEVRKDGVTNRNLGIPLPSDTYTLNSMTPGTYDIGVGLWSTDGFLFSHVDVRVPDPPEESPIEPLVTVNKGWRVAGRVDRQSPTGEWSPAAGVQTTLGRPGSADTQSATSAADGTFVIKGASEGLRRVRVDGLPMDSYVLSIKEGNSDVLRDGIQIHGDTSMHVVIGESGGAIDGNVVNAENAKISDAIVVLVPDDLPSMTSLYRTTNTDQNGTFATRGIAPGAYHLYAWRELEGAAYRSTDFMKAFLDQGIAVTIETAGHLSLDLKLAK